MEKIQLSFRLNGKPYSVETQPTRRMLDVLREDLHLTGTKEGCGVGVRYEDDVIEQVVIPAIERALRDSAIEPPELF